MNRLNLQKVFFSCFLFPAIIMLSCTEGLYVQGQYFPSLANPGGTGRILFFYMENMEYYTSQSVMFDDTEKIEQLTNRLKVDLNLLCKQYPYLRVDYVDISQKRHIAIEHRVYNIPTVILFDRMGYEVRRWIPQDYERGGGSMYEMNKTIQKMNIEKTTEP